MAPRNSFLFFSFEGNELMGDCHHRHHDGTTAVSVGTTPRPPLLVARSAIYSRAGYHFFGDMVQGDVTGCGTRGVS